MLKLQIVSINPLKRHCFSLFVNYRTFVLHDRAWKRLRNALFSSYLDKDHKKPMLSSWRINSGFLSASMSPRDNYASLRRKNRELKLELARLRMRLNDLEKDHVCMKRSMEKTGSQRFMSSFSKKLGKLGFFVHGSSSRGSTSPSKAY
ncbi:hypothetical protein Droror1_Dr00020316 [Drosera rotundifolia]